MKQLTTGLAVCGFGLIGLCGPATAVAAPASPLRVGQKVIYGNMVMPLTKVTRDGHGASTQIGVCWTDRRPTGRSVFGFKVAGTKALVYKTSCAALPFDRGIGEKFW